MWQLYLIASLPVFVWAYLYFKDVEVAWWEWVLGCAAGFITCVAFHYVAIAGMTSDVETWSGEITSATHHPRWVEEYTEYHSETVDDGNGKSHTRTWTTIEHRTHPEHWTCADNLDRDLSIAEDFFEQIRRNFNDLETERPYKSGFDSGDPNIYVSYNRTGFVYPVTDLRTFQNRIKAAPTVFSYAKVPADIKVFPYPKNRDWLSSDRLVGAAEGRIDKLTWDRMNTRLGPSKKVNLIMVGFNSPDSQLGNWQEAAWIGGKKNDLVITYGYSDDPLHPTWVKVFGWTEQEIVKRNLETLVLQNPIQTSLIPLIEKEVRQNYQLKNWHKFDYITIDPPGWSYIILLLIMIGTQGGIIWWAVNNNIGRYAAISDLWSR